MICNGVPIFQVNVNSTPPEILLDVIISICYWLYFILMVQGRHQIFYTCQAALQLDM